MFTDCACVPVTDRVVSGDNYAGLGLKWFAPKDMLVLCVCMCACTHKCKFVCTGVCMCALVTILLRMEIERSTTRWRHTAGA